MKKIKTGMELKALIHCCFFVNLPKPTIFMPILQRFSTQKMFDEKKVIVFTPVNNGDFKFCGLKVS